MSQPAIPLDLRQIVARERHALIFRELDRLNVGETLTFINDHDPKPLYYQIKAERPGAFSWHSQEVAQHEWRVQAQRLQACEPLEEER